MFCYKCNAIKSEEQNKTPPAKGRFLRTGGVINRAVLIKWKFALSLDFSAGFVKLPRVKKFSLYSVTENAYEKAVFDDRSIEIGDGTLLVLC